MNGSNPGRFKLNSKPSRWASRLYASGATYDELHLDLKQKLDLFEPDIYRPFKLSIDCSHHKITWERQVFVYLSVT